MTEYVENDVISICRDIYRQSIKGGLSEKDADYLEDVFLQTTGVYKTHESQEITNLTNQGRNVEKLQNIIKKLCQGKHSANQEIKEFLLEKGYVTENNGQIEFSSSFILQTPDNNLPGGCTKSDKDGNVLIVINQQMAERSDSSLAVALGHEICHQMVNDKLKQNVTSAEVEAICDIVGLVAAKGAGYDIREKIKEDEKDFSRDVQKQIYKRFYSKQSDEFIEQKVDEHMENIVNTFYMPKKLKTIAEFIDDKYDETTAEGSAGAMHIGYYGPNGKPSEATGFVMYNEEKLNGGVDVETGEKLLDVVEMQIGVGMQKK